MNENPLEDLMLKFMYRYYPVLRHKINGRFKRSILFDNGYIYQLSNKREMNQIYYNLIDILKIVFKCNEETCKNVLNQIL